MPDHQFLGWTENLTMATKLNEVLFFFLAESQSGFQF